jgi:uncharacterized protein YjiS (DUF1127 family)
MEALMSISDVSQTFPPLRRMSERVRRLVRALLAADDRFRLANRLDALDEHMLQDLGISRADADREARRLRQL